MRFGLVLGGLRILRCAQCIYIPYNARLLILLFLSGAWYILGNAVTCEFLAIVEVCDVLSG